MDYDSKAISRMKYYLPELEAMLIKHPNSLSLINGIAHIRKILGLPQTVEAIDPLRFIDELTERTMQEKKGR
jgi:hypothetical protein